MEKYTPTPEEKAILHEKQLLKDAEFVNWGAKFKPGTDGEPILNLTKQQQLEIQWRDAPESLPESYALSKMINESPNRLPRAEILNTVSSHKLRPSGSGEHFDGAKSEVECRNGDVGISLRPYIKISRYELSSSSYDLTTHEKGSIICYSLQEFYDNLKPEEREKGEAWGKELESFLEK